MLKPLFCRITVKGHLSDQWTDWFGGLTIENQPEGEAILSGRLPDQAALFGVLSRLYGQGLALLSIYCTPDNPEKPPGQRRPGDPGRKDQVDFDGQF